MLVMAATRVGSMSHLKPAADASRKMLRVVCGGSRHKKAKVQILETLESVSQNLKPVQIS